MKEEIDYTRSKRHGILNFQVRDVESGRAGHILAMIAFTPIRVECLHYKGCYEMMGLSPVFPKLDEGLTSPHYDLLIRTDDNGDIATVTLKK